ncbi:MAG: hypothetical protein II553_04285 [Lachnospiraceae bacterium]|nr:hypothetical protein [Lachnospiraceae bacterium]
MSKQVNSAPKKNAVKRDGAKAPLTLWRKVIYILAGAAVFGVVLSVILFALDKKPASASARLQLTFDGAAEGIAPDGRRFDINELASDEVVAEALKAAGLDSRYSVEKIRQSLVVAGAYPEDIVNQTMSYESLLDFTTNRTLTAERFNPTLFTVKLNNNFDPKISQKDLESILKNILTVYKAKFAEAYTQGVPSNAATFVLSDYDYPQQLEILQQRLAIVSRYAEEMYEKEPTFKYRGAGFNDIVVRLNALTDSDIGRLNANLTLNALTKDPERLLTQYRFELRDLGNSLSKRRAQLSLLDKLIASYEKSEILYISTKDSLTKIDGDSTKTYDALVDIRRGVADGNTKLSSQIATYELKLSDLTGEPVVKDDKTDKGGSGDGTDGTQQGADGTGETGEQGDGTQSGTGNGNAGTGNAGDNGNSGENGDAGNTDNGSKMPAAAKLDMTATAAQREALEKEIAALEEKSDVVIKDFSEMLAAWNDQKVNDTTVSVSNYRYDSQKLVSGAFIKKTIMTAGPISALAMILCLCMIIAAKSRELKAEA